MTQPFGSLRSHLHGPHTPHNWSQLCALLEDYPSHDLTEVILPYVNGHLDKHWPDRQRPVPERWFSAMGMPTERPSWLNRPHGPAQLGAWMRVARHLLIGHGGLTGCSGEIAALGHTGWLEHLTQIHVAGHHCSEADLEALCTAAYTPNLRELRIQDLWQRRSIEHLLRVLDRAEPWPQLRALSLDGSAFDAHDIARLAGSGALEGVRWLSLSRMELRDRAVEALVEAHALADVEHLRMWENTLGHAGWAALTNLPNLRTIDSGDTPLPRTARDLLAARGVLRRAQDARRLIRVTIRHLGTLTPEVIDFDQRHVRVGNSTQLNDLSLSHHAIQRRHVDLWREDDAVYCKSSEGIVGLYLNDRRLAGPTRLATKDRILLGESTLSAYLVEA